MVGLGIQFVIGITGFNRRKTTLSIHVQAIHIEHNAEKYDACFTATSLCVDEYDGRRPYLVFQADQEEREGSPCAEWHATRKESGPKNCAMAREGLLVKFTKGTIIHMYDLSDASRSSHGHDT